MDSRVAFICVVLAAFAVVQTIGAPQGADPSYTTKYDTIDVDQILSSKRLVSNYMQCLLDKKPCTADGTELRKILPDAIKTQCVKCTANQKNIALRVIDRLQTEYDSEWQQLLDKWDPKRELSKAFDEFITAERKKGFTKFLT